MQIFMLNIYICTYFNDTINASKLPTSFKSANIYILVLFKNRSRTQKYPIHYLKKYLRRSSVSNYLTISKTFFQIFSAVSRKASALNIAYYWWLKSGKQQLVIKSFLDHFLLTCRNCLRASVMIYKSQT